VRGEGGISERWREVEGEAEKEKGRGNGREKIRASQTVRKSIPFLGHIPFYDPLLFFTSFPSSFSFSLSLFYSTFSSFSFSSSFFFPEFRASVGGRGAWNEFRFPRDGDRES